MERQVGRDQHRVRAKSDAQPRAIGLAEGGKPQFTDARRAVLDFGLEHIHHTDESGDEFVRRLLIDFARRADLLERSASENNDTIGHLEGFLLVVSDKERRHVDLVVHRNQPFAQFLSNFRIHRAERFIQQEHAWLRRERAGNGHALTLAARKLVRIAPFQPFKAEQVEQFSNSRFDVGSFPFFDLQTEGNIVEDVHVFEEGVILKHETDIPLLHR